MMGPRFRHGSLLVLLLSAVRAAADPEPDSRWPQLLGAQFTYVLQHQDALEAPYSGRLSLQPDGDTQPTYTIGGYLGWAPVSWGQLYFDTEKFMGAGVSGATGLGSLTNGDVVREGANNLKKTFYIARLYARCMLTLGSHAVRVERAQDQVPGTEADTRLELKIGRMAVNDDFDKNRYAAGARTQFLNWSLWANTAWDYAANTRGFTDGVVLGYVSPRWALRYGIYRMPEFANGQALVGSLRHARGENLELTVAPAALPGTVIRALLFRNTAAMGIYDQALALAAGTGAVPSISADDRAGRHKTGFGLNVEQPLSQDGDTGVFARVGWNDGKTESFAFTEVDNEVGLGGQLSGEPWRRKDDRVGAAVVSAGLSSPHREYLGAGGSGFLLDDGRLNYRREQALEVYYRVQLTDSVAGAPIKAQVSPDFQFIRNPGFNADRGPARFWGIRAHLEY